MLFGDGFAAYPRVSFASLPPLLLQPKDKLPVYSTSYCVYQFTCTCVAGYLDRTTRIFSERLKKHHPSWLNTGSGKNRRASKTMHLIELDHQIHVNATFCSVYTAREILEKHVENQSTSTVEAIVSYLNGSLRSSQKLHVGCLNSCWSSAQDRVTWPVWFQPTEYCDANIILYDWQNQWIWPTSGKFWGNWLYTVDWPVIQSQHFETGRSIVEPNVPNQFYQDELRSLRHTPERSQMCQGQTVNDF